MQKLKLNQILDMGYEIACHTFGHISLDKASYRAVRQDLDRFSEQICMFLGNRAKQVRYFVYPYGHLPANPKIQSLIGARYSAGFGVGGIARPLGADFNSYDIPRIEIGPADFGGPLRASK